MADILILGGTRNLGHIIAASLLEAGHKVSVLNRGLTRDELPAEVERLKASRGDTALLRSTIGDRNFNMIVDMTTYTGADAREAVSVFQGRAERYVFSSSGQVYLVRDGALRPFCEDDYDGPLVDAPPQESPDYNEWKYGADKRDAEAVFDQAKRENDFPVTTLRLPMVASERDHYGRIQGYFARLRDGGPILIPDERGLPLRHVYAGDVARLIANLCGSSAGIGTAFNISFGESTSLEEYLELLASVAGKPLRLALYPRDELERQQLLPNCSPFSGRWMSELDNSLATSALDPAISYTSPRDYLPAIFEDYMRRWMSEGLHSAGYAQRSREVQFLSGASVRNHD